MISRCVLFVVVSCLLACTYEPDGKYVNPYIYQPPETIPASINIEDVNGEYRLVFPTNFWMSVDMAGKSLVYVKAVRDGEEISIAHNYDKFNFVLDPVQLKNGTNEIDIEVKLSSGSGSIAEGLGLEYYLVQRKLVVTVDKSTPSPVTNLSATMVNGHLTLTWIKPSHEHYHYSINKFDGNDNFLGSVTIADADVTTYVDEGFVGGKVSYEVVLQSSFFAGVGTNFVTIELQPIEVLSSLDGNGQLKLKWNVLTSFGPEVFIRISGRHFTQDMPWAGSESVVDSLYLGDVATATLWVFRNGFEEDGYSISNTHWIGSKIKPFDQYSLIESSNKLIVHPEALNAKTYRYDATTFVVEDSAYFYGPGYFLASSENGTHEYLIREGYAYSFDPMDLSQWVTQISLHAIYWPLYHSDLKYPGYFNVSNDNFLVFTNQSFAQQNGQRIVTMDLNTKQLWGTEKAGTKVDISEDGDFMVVTDQISRQDAMIYRRGVSDWEEMGKIPFGKMFFSHDPGNRLVRSDNGTTDVYDLTLSPDGNGYFSAMVSSPLDATGFDHINNRVLAETINEKLVSTISTYSIDDLKLISTHRARLTSDFSSRHIIIGDMQMVTDGFIKSIE